MEYIRKCEIYVPDRYINENGEIVSFSEPVLQSYIETIVNLILVDEVTGVSIRDETGYYQSSVGLTIMHNKVIYFYYNCRKNLDAVRTFIKSEMHQETVLIVKDGVAKIC